MEAIKDNRRLPKVLGYIGLVGLGHVDAHRRNRFGGATVLGEIGGKARSRVLITSLAGVKHPPGVQPVLRDPAFAVCARYESSLEKLAFLLGQVALAACSGLIRGVLRNISLEAALCP